MKIKVLDEIIEFDIYELEQDMLECGYIPNDKNYKLELNNTYDGLCFTAFKKVGYKNMEWEPISDKYLYVYLDQLKDCDLKSKLTRLEESRNILNKMIDDLKLSFSTLSQDVELDNIVKMAIQFGSESN